jgi:hypothetical protein
MACVIVHNLHHAAEKKLIVLVGAGYGSDQIEKVESERRRYQKIIGLGQEGTVLQVFVLNDSVEKD